MKELNKLQIKWLEALYSKKYKQGMGELRSGKNEFCCLGVLCDVKNKRKWLKSNFGRGNYLYDGKSYSIDSDLAKKAGIEGFTDRLIEANDEKNKSFKQIAVILENHWKKS